MPNLINKIRKTIERFHLLSPGERVLVAVSGGPDSMALLEVLYRLKDEFHWELFVAHYDHRLRKESGEEALFVYREARKRGLPFILGTTSVREYAKREGLGLEAAGRELRYKFFERVADRLAAEKIALAHQADDLAEEVLLRFIRGAGRRGLAGIPVKRGGKFIRPLLLASKEEVEKFLQEEAIPYVIDTSNEDPRFLRNRVRHLLIPFLEKHFHRKVKECLKRTALIVAEEEEFLGELAEEALKRHGTLLKEAFILSVKGLKKMPLALRRRVFLEALKVAGVPLFRIRLSHLEQLESLVEGRARSHIDLPRAFIARREPGRIVIKKASPFPKPYRLEIKGPGIYSLPDGRELVVELAPPKKAPQGAVIIDLQKIKGKLYVRSPLPGDRIRPPGFPGRRKLKKLFWERKLSHESRRLWPVIEFHGQIVGLPGFFTDEAFLASPEQEKALIIYLKDQRD